MRSKLKIYWEAKLKSRFHANDTLSSARRTPNPFLLKISGCKFRTDWPNGEAGQRRAWCCSERHLQRRVHPSPFLPLPHIFQYEELEGNIRTDSYSHTLLYITNPNRMFFLRSLKLKNLFQTLSAEKYEAVKTWPTN